MGKLYIVGTPIGNLADMTKRAEETLGAVDHILAEDTRRARVLLAHIGVTTRPLSLHAHNEARRTGQVTDWLNAGEDVALISDAGTPLLSDPGERTVHAALEEGHAVVPIPGASAILAGLVASGLPCVPFTFVGFLPRRAGKRERAVKRICEAEETTVLFESPQRLEKLLDDIAGGVGPTRRVAVCRELTKLHEEVYRGTPAEAARYYREVPPRGEVTVILEGLEAGRTKAGEVDAETLAAECLAGGMAPSKAAKHVARAAGITRAEAYAAVQRAKGRPATGGDA